MSFYLKRIHTTVQTAKPFLSPLMRPEPTETEVNPQEDLKDKQKANKSICLVTDQQLQSQR